MTLARSGRWGATDVPTTPIRARGLNLDLRCRPGTSDFATFVEIFVDDEYALAEDLISAPVRTVLDLGANVGLAAAYFHRIWPAARICLVEPDAQNAAIATKAVSSLIADGRAEVRRNLVGSHSRMARLERGADANESRMGSEIAAVPPDLARHAVQVLTVGQIMELAGMQTVDLLKCDIEGAEGEVFDDCSAWIHRVGYLVIELHNGLSTTWLKERLAAGGASPQVLSSTSKPIEGLSVVWVKCNADDSPAGSCVGYHE
jgi:FkbM family methyltransferase